MPRYAWNKAPQQVKRRYFELIRQGWSGAAASSAVGVSLSCGSLWFIDAGSVSFVETPISSRYLSQDDRIEIADGLGRKDPVKAIAVRIGKSYQSVYKDVARNRRPDGRYQPWHAHNHAHQRRRRPKPYAMARDDVLRELVAGKLGKKRSPAQISRWLRRRYPRRKAWHLCVETIYEAVSRGLVTAATGGSLRTGRTYRRRRGRGRSRDGSLKQSTNLTPLARRPAHVQSRRQAGHWEGDRIIIGAGQRSAIATLVERKTRLTILVAIRGGHSAQIVGDALIACFTRLPTALRRSLTWDQGNEMFQHDRIAAATGLKIYFADPHSPWQRGTNENTNGLLRQYFPKGTDLSCWSQEHLDGVSTELNQRPRLCLQDLTSTQAVRRWWRPLEQPVIRHD